MSSSDVNSDKEHVCEMKFSGAILFGMLAGSTVKIPGKDISYSFSLESMKFEDLQGLVRDALGHRWQTEMKGK